MYQKLVFRFELILINFSNFKFYSTNFKTYILIIDFSGTPGTPVKPNHLEIMGNGSSARSTNGNVSLVFPQTGIIFEA